jgi:hypothetical protein
MQGIYLPGAVAAGLVATLLKIGELGQNSNLNPVHIAFGFLLTIYFSLSFLANERLHFYEKQSLPQVKYKYTWFLFTIDALETASITCAFYFLGFFITNGVPQYKGFYATLILPTILHAVWSSIAYKGDKVRPVIYVINTLRGLLMVIGFIWDNGGWYFTLACVAFAILILHYCRVTSRHG